MVPLDRPPGIFSSKGSSINIHIHMTNNNDDNNNDNDTNDTNNIMINKYT